jgi:hypothetical protein
LSGSIKAILLFFRCSCARLRTTCLELARLCQQMPCLFNCSFYAPTAQVCCNSQRNSGTACSAAKWAANRLASQSYLLYLRSRPSVWLKVDSLITKSNSKFSISPKHLISREKFSLQTPIERGSVMLLLGFRDNT